MRADASACGSSAKPWRGRGLDPQTVADRHELDVADVYRALAYYHEHPGEMARFEKQRSERNERLGEVALGPEDVDTDEPTPEQ